MTNEFKFASIPFDKKWFLEWFLEKYFSGDSDLPEELFREVDLPNTLQNAKISRFTEDNEKLYLKLRYEV